MEIVAIVGVLTALMAASIGLVQNDIKRVLAYSTVSQLGYMFTAMGVGAFSAGAFHLMTHAFFKALLFLGSGSVIHAMAGEQDMRRMGGLKKYLPVTFIDDDDRHAGDCRHPAVLGLLQQGRDPVPRLPRATRLIWVLAVATALMTAFYMFRLMSMTFFGGYRGPAWEAAGHGARAPRRRTSGRGDARRGPSRRSARARPGARDDHEVSHGPAEPHDGTRGRARRPRPRPVARSARIAARR